VLSYFLITGHPGVLMGSNVENEASRVKSTLAYIFFPIFKKKKNLQPHINSEELYLGRILNFVPELK
jgi:hypothetical protein